MTVHRSGATDDEVDLTVRFVTDGRTSTPPGTRADDFAAVFGRVLTAPTFRVGAVVPFDARLVTPDGEVVYARAHLHYPADPFLVHETEFMVLLYAVDAVDVPASTLITSVTDVPDDPAAWAAATARTRDVMRFVNPQERPSLARADLP